MGVKFAMGLVRDAVGDAGVEVLQECFEAMCQHNNHKGKRIGSAKKGLHELFTKKEMGFVQKVKEEIKPE